MEPVELRALVGELTTRLNDARMFLDIEGKQAELVELREQASAPDLWDDQDRARQITSRLARHEQTIQHVADLDTSIEDVGVLLDLAIEEGDKASIAEVESAGGQLIERGQKIGTLGNSVKDSPGGFGGNRKFS